MKLIWIVVAGRRTIMRAWESQVLGGGIASLMVAAAAYGGPDWVEGNDAGALPGSSQGTSGGTLLNKISGTLTGPSGQLGVGGGDFQDMYLIKITDPLHF